MASNTLICSHENIFNKSILQNDAIYFSDKNQLIKIIEGCKKSHHKNLSLNNYDKIKNIYSWNNIISSYEQLLCEF